MKICMMNSPYEDVAKEIRFAGESGFHGLELIFEHPISTPEEILSRSRQLLDLFSTYNLIKIAHTQTFVNICDVYESVRKASIKETEKSLEAAYKLNIEFLTVHPGFLWPLMSKEEAFQRSCKSLEELLNRAEDYGLTIGLENLPPRFFPPIGYFTTTEEFEELFNQQKSDKLTFVLDLAHASLRGSDLPLDFISKLYGKLAHVHLSDHLGERDDHFPLGVGKVDYKSLIKDLTKRSYDKTLTLEIFARDKDYLLLSKRKVEEITKI